MAADVTDRHVVLWSGHCIDDRVHEISADAKVAHLNVAAPTEQNVGRLYVAMNHIQLSFEIVQGTQHLHEHIHFLREATQLRPDFSKMAADRHLGFVMLMFGPPTKGIWWPLSLCKSWLESMQYFRYYMPFLIFCELGLKTPIRAPKLGFWRQHGEGMARCWPPNELVLTLGVVTFVPLLAKIDQEMRSWECEQTDGHTHWQRQTEFTPCLKNVPPLDCYTVTLRNGNGFWYFLAEMLLIE